MTTTRGAPVSTVAPAGEAPLSPARLLAQIPPGKYHVLSCYLQLRPEDRRRGAYWRALKDRAKQVLESEPMAALPREDRLAVERDVARLEAATENSARLPHSRGLAMFACEALNLLMSVPLPRVHRTRLVLDDTPWVRELVEEQGRFGRILAVVIDRAHDRFFEVSAAGVEECADEIPVAQRGGRYRPDRSDAPGWGERDYQSRIREQGRRHYAAVAHRLEALAARGPIRGIVLAGPLKHTAALRQALPPHLAAHLLGTVRANPTSITPAQVETIVLEAAEAQERTTVERQLAALKEGLGTGTAVDGPRETLLALARGQVRQLFLRAALEGSGYRCATTNRLALSESECAGEGAPLPLHDLADEVVEEALRQGIEVITIEDEESARTIDGFAATLRFRP
jgi:peptide subunit release factor 1 (eRF1)